MALCCKAEPAAQYSYTEGDVPSMASPVIDSMLTGTGPLQLAVQTIVEVTKSELQQLKTSQEHVERRQVKLEQVIREWMDRGDETHWKMKSQLDALCKHLLESNLSAINLSMPAERGTPQSSFGSKRRGEPTMKPQPTEDAHNDANKEGQQLASVEAAKGAPEPTQVDASPAQKTRHVVERTLIQRIVFSNFFDIFFGSLIVLNAVAIGSEVEYKTVYARPSDVFTGIAYAFAILFTIELVLRFIANGAHRYFLGKERSWNWFDIAMVAVSLVEVVDSLATSGEDPDEKDGGGGAARLLRMVRMARLMRIVRVLRFSPQLRMMLFMIFESMKSLGWLVCLLLSILYIFSICLTMGATEYLGASEAPTTNDRFRSEVKEYYGTVVRSIYTCFKSMTGGQSWGEVLDPLIDVSIFYVLIYLFYIAFSILALLNIVTGVFVDGALAKSQNDRDLVVEKELQQKQAYITNLKELFVESDMDESGTISLQEFETHMQDPKVEAYLSHLSIDTTNITELFKQLDRDESGYIGLDEFVDNLLHLIRGQSIEQYVQKLMNENRNIQFHLFKFMEFVEGQFDHIHSLVGVGAWQDSGKSEKEDAI